MNQPAKTYIVGNRDSYGHYRICERRMVKVPVWRNGADVWEPREEIVHLFNVTDPTPYRAA